MLKAGGQQTGFISLCREILTRFIEERFPTLVEGLVSYDLILCIVVLLIFYNLPTDFE